MTTALASRTSMPGAARVSSQLLLCTTEGEYCGAACSTAHQHQLRRHVPECLTKWVAGDEADCIKGERRKKGAPGTSTDGRRGWHWSHAQTLRNAALMLPDLRQQAETSGGFLLSGWANWQRRDSLPTPIFPDFPPMSTAGVT